MIAKKNLSCLLLLASALLIVPCLRAGLPDSSSANLTVGYANGGTVTPVVAGSTLTITSTAPTTVLNWGNFWDGTVPGGTATNADTVAFTLPAATSSLLNVIAGTGTANPTMINGNITSTGKVFFLNTNGIVVGPTGNINAVGFYASTILENISYFEQNGTLQVFSNTPPVFPTTKGITVTNGAVITTVGSTGDIRLAGNGITIGGGALAGNVYLVDTGATTPAAVNLATTAAVTIPGGLSITSNGGAVLLSDGAATSVTGNLAITSGGGNVDLAHTASATTITGTSSINTTGTTNGNVVTTAGTFTSGATTLVTGTGSSATDGTVSITGLGLGTNPITVTGGSTALSDTTDATLTLGNMTLSGTLTITSTGNITTQNFGSTAATPAAVTLTANSGNGISLTSNGTISFNGSGAENFTTLSNSGAVGAVTITTTGNIALNPGSNISIPTLSLATTSGTITQTTTAADFISSSTLLTLNAPTVSLANTSNTIANVVLLGGATGGIALSDATATLTVANGTAATGNVSLTNRDFGGGGNTSISLGASNTDVLSFGGNLSLNLTGSGGAAPAHEQILTAAGTVTVTGNTTVVSSAQSGTAANNSVTLGNSAAPTPAYTFTGPVSVTFAGGPGALAGNINLFATSGLVLGTINTGAGATLTAASTLVGTANGSGITDPSGVVTSSGAATFAAGTIASPSPIQIGTTAAPAALTGAIAPNIASSLTLINSVPTTIVAGANPITGLTSITQTGTAGASAVTITDSLAKLSIADTGTAPTGNVAVTIPTGNVALSNWTVSGAGVTVAVTVTNGSITLGSGINDSNLAATTFTTTGANASSPVSIYGAVTFSSDGPINVSNNTSSSLGGITLVATNGNNSNISYTEGSGANIQGITVPAGYTGTIALTSVNSLLLEIGATSLHLPATGTLTLTANSLNGGVLFNAAGAVNSILGPISLTTTGNSALVSSQSLTLGSVSVTAGTFTADTTAGAAMAITEGSGSTIVVSGATTLNTNGGVITLNQTGNKFGTLTVDTTDAGVTAAGANATIKQYTSSVYASVNTGTAGGLSATSETGSVSETGNTGVFSGGTTTLAAPSGSITFKATGNQFNGGALVITTTGNAAVTDSSPITQLGGGTNVTGSLTVANTSANGVIKDNGTNGNITVGGTAILTAPTTGTGDVNFRGVYNSIAALEIKAGSGTTTFYDNASLLLEPGTEIIGTATIASGGSLTTGSGPMTFGAGVNLNANGNITLSDLGINFGGHVTAVATGASGDVNFSALSLVNNFNGLTPSVTTSNNATLYQAPGP